MHIYSTTKYSGDVTLEQFIESTRKTLAEAEDFANDVNGLAPHNREKLLSKVKYINEKYVRLEDNRLIVDRNLANIDIVNHKITKHIYRTSVSLTEEQRRQGFNIEVKTYTKIDVTDKLMGNPNAKVSFKDLFLEYADLRETGVIYSFDDPHYRMQLIELKNPLVRDAYEKLGRAEVEKQDYVQTNIKRELTKQLDIATENKIVKLIRQTIPPQKAVPKSDVKEKLQGIYDSLNINRKAKATDLADWFKVEQPTRTINGKSVACIVIINDEFLKVEHSDTQTELFDIQ